MGIYSRNWYIEREFI